jgi:type II secretory pathway pseudopilin PulG
MPIGDCRRSAPRRGFTYLLLLFVVAATGVGAATLGTRWQTLAQRERETELVFRGLQLRAALQRYHDQTPDGQPKRPQQLEDLLQDTRGGPQRHLLRQLYNDPFTGRPDWVLLRDAEGGIVGVHSRSTTPTLRRHGLPPEVSGMGSAATSVDQWQFAIANAQNKSRTP